MNAKERPQANIAYPWEGSGYGLGQWWDKPWTSYWVITGQTARSLFHGYIFLIAQTQKSSTVKENTLK